MYFSGATTVSMESYTKTTLKQNADKVILHIGTNESKIDKRTTRNRK